MIPKTIQNKLIACLKKDQELTDKLKKEGQLEAHRYHPLLEEMHKTHAIFLNQVIQDYGFPTPKNSSKEVSDAAFIVLQHAISMPLFMIKTFELIQHQLDVNPITLAYLEDRIHFFKRKPQRFGTQYDYTLEGSLEVWWLDGSIEDVDVRRKNLGLPTIEENNQRFENVKRFTKEEANRMRDRQNEWLIKTGWCDKIDIKTCEIQYGK